MLAVALQDRKGGQRLISRACTGEFVDLHEWPMAHENLVGLHVNDESSYQRYREHMTPILRRYEGGFRYDFKIAETLKSSTPAAINRVFVIFFRDAAAKTAFFADPEYVAVRERYFVPAVDAVTIMAEFDS